MDGAGQQHYLAGHDRLEALVHQLDADSPLVLDEDANDSLAGEKGHAARGQVRTGISVYRAASPLVRDRRRICNSDTDHAVISSPKDPGPLCTPALISFTSSKQHGTPLYRSSCARKPRPLFRADMFQPLDAPRLVPRTAMYPRNPLACRQPSLELSAAAYGTPWSRPGGRSRRLRTAALRSTRSPPGGRT